MKTYQPMPDSLADAASFLTPVEQEELWRAAILMADSRGLMMRLTAMFGRRIEAVRARAFKSGERIGGSTWNDALAKVQAVVEDTLWNSYNLATLGLEGTPVALRPKHARPNPVHKAAAAASGVASGFVGLPGVLFDIPFTTTTILRSIAEIARDSGENLGDEDTQRACLEVLAFGGPSSADDETEIGYWATRIGMNHLAINVLVRSASGRFGMLISEKFLAQAVPVAGAVAGGLLNYAFTDYYQTMARVHFTLRALTRSTNQPVQVRQCFQTMVHAARERRRISRKPEKAAQSTAFLPKAQHAIADRVF